jgi:putative FmdB family regulatory protein
MPIYEYRCAKCGFQDEYLQKVSARPLKVCPSCGKAKFEKLLSAPGFHLKGSGWYATDFKGGNKPVPAKADAKSEEKSEVNAEAKSEVKSEAKSEAKAASKAESKSEAKADSAKGEKTPASTTH